MDPPVTPSEAEGRTIRYECELSSSLRCNVHHPQADARRSRRLRHTGDRLKRGPPGRPSTSMATIAPIRPAKPEHHEALQRVTLRVLPNSPPRCSSAACGGAPASPAARLAPLPPARRRRRRSAGHTDSGAIFSWIRTRAVLHFALPSCPQTARLDPPRLLRDAPAPASNPLSLIPDRKPQMRLGAWSWRWVARRCAR